MRAKQIVITTVLALLTTLGVFMALQSPLISPHNNVHIHITPNAPTNATPAIVVLRGADNYAAIVDNQCDLSVKPGKYKIYTIGYVQNNGSLWTAPTQTISVSHLGTRVDIQLEKHKSASLSIADYSDLQHRVQALIDGPYDLDEKSLKTLNHIDDVLTALQKTQ